MVNGEMASSPTDSIPSLGEITQASSDDDGVCRKLFPSPEVEVKHREKWESTNTDIVKPGRLILPESRSGDDTSTSIRTGREPPIAEVNAHQEAVPSPPSPPKRTSVKNLVGIFSMFDAYKPNNWPPSTFQKKSQPLAKDETANRSLFGNAGIEAESGVAEGMVEDNEPSPSSLPSTIVTTDDTVEKWKQKAQALERECSALQGIVCADSVNITKLKKACAELQDSNTQHISEISLLSSTLKSMAEKVRYLEREKEEQQDLETARVETIRALKEEIERLKQTRPSEIGASSSQELGQSEPEDLAQMKFEHELFAAQIIRDEAAMKVAHDALEEKDALLRQFKQRIEVLRARLVATEAIEERIAAMELENHMTLINYEEALKERDLELAEARTLLAEATRVKKTREDEEMNRSRRTELHLVETEQDLETALQLLKEQEEQIWYLEDRIVQLTNSEKDAQSHDDKVPEEVPTPPCPMAW